VSNDLCCSQAGQLLALAKLRRMIGVSRSTIHKWLCAGILPAPVQINGRNYWRAAEIVIWIESQQRVEYTAA